MDVYVEHPQTAAQFTASEPGGMIRAVVDGTGRLVNLSVTPELLHPAAAGDWTTLAGAIERAAFTAIADAQRSADVHRARAVASPDGPCVDVVTHHVDAPPARVVARVAVPAALLAPAPADLSPGADTDQMPWVALAPRRKR